MAELGARELLAILGRLAPNAYYRIPEIARSIGVDAARLKTGLETLSVCGVAPYGPGDCLPLLVRGDLLFVTGELPGVSGPVRLSVGEARALAAALQAAGFHAEDELTERLLSAAGSASFDAKELERTVRATIDGHSPEVFEALSQATAASAVVRIGYTRMGAAEVTERDIEPVTLYAERGAWYVTAWCRRSDGWRTFRVDRIASAALTGERFASRAAGPVGSPPLTSPERFAALRKATLRFTDPVAFDEREWPGAEVVGTGPDGCLVVEVPYGGLSWISRRVVARLGKVVAVAPDEVRTAVADLAAELLAIWSGGPDGEPASDLG